MRRGLALLPLVLLALAATASAAQPGPSGQPLVEVVVTLGTEPLAVARPGRTFAATGGRRLSLETATSRSYLRTLAASQGTLQSRIDRSAPALARTLPSLDAASASTAPEWPVK